jgi:chromosome segregation ATPase
MDLVLDAAQVIKSAKRSGKTEHYRERLIVELQSHLADALEKIHKMSAQKETREAVIESIKGDVIKLTSKVDEFRSIMASIRGERDHAVAQAAANDQAFTDASAVRAIISNSQSKAMLRMAAALADLLPMHPNEPRSEHQSRGEAITMHAIVLTDAEWAAWLTRSSH